MGTNVGKDVKRGFLGLATLGTSEIKTGAGQYGDETVADALFPKTVNDAMLDDRANARKGKDADQQALVDKAATQAALQPDASDRALATSRRQGAIRLMSGRGRKSSFINGGGY